MGSLTAWEDNDEEHLSDLVSYKLPQSRAGAIVSRRFVSFMPAGSNVYGPASGPGRSGSTWSGMGLSCLIRCS